MTDTKESILDAAARLFAERGFDAASLRAITAAAGVNLAAVNYHFRSKDRLLDALFARGMQALNRKRVAMLEAFEAESGALPVPVDRLVRAVIEPMFDAEVCGGRDGRAFGLLLGRMYAAPDARLDRIMLGDIGQVAERFEPAFRRSLPGVPPEDLYWRAFFAIGAAAHTLASCGLIEAVSQGRCDPQDRPAALEKLVAFITAGLKAPAGAPCRVRPPGRPLKKKGKK